MAPPTDDRSSLSSEPVAELVFNRAMTFAYGVPQEVAPGVMRIVARNPGPMTFHGTNTYVIGSGDLTVIDPGPDDAAHLDAILEHAAGRRIRRLILTHAHSDHAGGLSALAALTGAQVCRFRLEPSPDAVPNSGSLESSAPLPALPLDRPLVDGDQIAGPDHSLTVLHTPGHAADHLCLALDGPGVLFSGDHVMGWNTSVVAPPGGRMRDYLRSLERLLTRDDQIYLAGHGDTILSPQRLTKAYLLHRRWREASILQSLKDGKDTIPVIVAALYPSIEPRIAGAAGLSVLAHIEHLMEQGFAGCDGPPGLSSAFYASRQA